jgi:GMP synthase-like glutamine amidotransferase
LAHRACSSEPDHGFSIVHLPMKIHYLQHEPDEGPGGVAAWAAERGHAIAGSRLFAGDAVPGLEGVDLLVVLGGGMNANDTERHPWLQAERRLIGEAVDAGRRVLGICLGAQLLADVLGGRVRRNPQPEIGWFPVRKTPQGEGVPLFAGFPAAAEVFHWHADTFDLPPGAVRVAESDACANQAFVLGPRIAGVQFHPEMTPTIAAGIVAAEGGALPAGRWVQPADEILAGDMRFRQMQGWLWDLLDRLAAVPPR